MITIEFLNSIRGDAPMYIEDGDSEQRKKIAQKIMELLKEGQAIFLIQGEEVRRIQGYDEASNQWLVFADPKPRPGSTHIPEPQPSAVHVLSDAPRRRGRPSLQRLSATGTLVTAIGRSAGG